MLHKALLARGVEVQVLADIEHVKVPYQIHEGVPIWGVPFPVLTSHALRPGMVSFARRWIEVRRVVRNCIPDIDLIQATTFRQPALFAYWLSQSSRVPWIATIACSGRFGDMEFCGNNWLLRRVRDKQMRSVSAVVALEDETREEVIRAGLPERKAHVIANALALRYIPHVERRREVFRAKEKRLLYIGRLSEQKRVDTLLKAFSSLVCARPDISLAIVGAGELRSALETTAAEYGVGSDVFAGHSSGPEQWLDQAFCFVNPSQSEGLPSAVLEACAFGVPVVLSDIPIHRKIAEKVGLSEFLFSPGDGAGLCNALQRLIACGEAELMSMATRCAQFAAQFTPQVRDDKYIALYERILAATK